jgi:hypothetical protein
MRAITTALGGGVLVAGFVISSAVGAAPAGSGASVVAQQNGVTTHRLCASEDVILYASGFAPGRRQVVASGELVGSGSLGTATIQLTDGSGSADIGSAGPDLIGAKVRVRYQTGSSDHPVNKGSFSARIVDC